jgi:hypothetical protein
MTKKDFILQQATQYFNKNGYGSVTLLELAQELNMSRGNLTYHFKDKNALLEAISEEMWAKIEKEKIVSRQFPSFHNLHNEIQLYYKFQKEYSFIFLDNHVLNDPLIKLKFRQMTEQTIADNRASIAFSIQLGNMKEEVYPGTYNNIAMITWMLTFFWLPQQVIRGDKSKEDGERLVWSILVPHFTEKGLKSFKKFFGEDILDQLGDPFVKDLSSLVIF